MENWKTGAKSLKLGHFLFPNQFWDSMRRKTVGVTPIPGGIAVKSLPLEDAPALQGHKCLEPVTRRYRPQPTVFEELVEVLYSLLVDVPANESARAPTPSGSTCFPTARE
jgi:hypothetical protein